MNSSCDFETITPGCWNVAAGAGAARAEGRRDTRRRVVSGSMISNF